MKRIIVLLITWLVSQAVEAYAEDTFTKVEAGYTLGYTSEYRFGLSARVSHQIPSNLVFGPSLDQSFEGSYSGSKYSFISPPSPITLTALAAEIGYEVGDPVKTAPPLPSIIPEGIPTPSILAGIIIHKYSSYAKR